MWYDEPIEKHNMSLVTHDIPGTMPNKFAKYKASHQLTADLYPHYYYGDKNSNFRRTALASVQDIPPHSPAKTMSKLEETSAHLHDYYQNDQYRDNHRNLPDQYRNNDHFQTHDQDPRVSVQYRSQYLEPIQNQYSDPYHQDQSNSINSQYKDQTSPYTIQQPYPQSIRPPSKKQKVSFADPQASTQPPFTQVHAPYPQLQPPFPQATFSQSQASAQSTKPPQPAIDPMEAYAISQLNRYTTPPMDYKALHPAVLKLPDVSADYLHSEYQDNFLPGYDAEKSEQGRKGILRSENTGKGVYGKSARLRSGYNIAHSEYEMNRGHTRQRNDGPVNVFNTAEDIPNQFKNDYRYHIIQAPDGKYHVYDISRWNNKIIYDDGRVKNVMPSTIDGFMKEFQSLDKLNSEYGTYVNGQRRQPSAHSIVKRDVLGRY